MENSKLIRLAKMANRWEALGDLETNTFFGCPGFETNQCLHLWGSPVDSQRRHLLAEKGAEPECAASMSQGDQKDPSMKTKKRQK